MPNMITNVIKPPCTLPFKIIRNGTFYTPGRGQGIFLKVETETVVCMVHGAIYTLEEDDQNIEVYPISGFTVGRPA